MKYALIGCGRIAVNHIIAAKANNLEIKAMCDININNVNDLINSSELNALSIKKYTDYKLMIEENPDIQLISIATSSGSHAEVAMYCIEHNINVIIEKPIAMNMADAESILQKAKEHNVKVCTNHQCRFNNSVQEIRKALESGRFGKISHGSISVRWWRNKEYYDQAKWRGTWAEDGGTLMNQCIHGIDLLRWMLGDEVESVYGVTRNRLHNYLEVEDLGMAILQFKNGSVGIVEGTSNIFPQNLEESLLISGEKGTVKLGGNSANNVEFWKFEDENEDDARIRVLTEPAPNVYGHGHIKLYKDMISAIEEDRPPYVDGIAGRNSLEIVLAIYKSMKTGQAVKLPLTDFNSTDMNGTF